METVVRQALSAAGITFEAVADTGGGDFVIVGAARKVPGNTTLSTSHGGYAGKSIIEKIRDDIDTIFNECFGEVWMSDNDPDRREHIKMCEGMCHVLGMLRSSSCDFEWEEAGKRYEANSAKSNS